MPQTAIIWLRRDLRLQDQPAFAAATKIADYVLPLYIHAPHEERPQAGAASRWWLHHSLSSLRQELRERGSDLFLDSGSSTSTLMRWAQANSASLVLCTAISEPWAEERDNKTAAELAQAGIELRITADGLLTDPHAIRNRSNTPYRAFTPFWRQVRGQLNPPQAKPAPTSLPPPPGHAHNSSAELEQLNLLDRVRWYDKFADYWQPGSTAASHRLARLSPEFFAAYPDERDFPAQPGTSLLSPHIHFGELSIREVWHQAAHSQPENHSGPANHSGVETYLAELGWREFAYHLLTQQPNLHSYPVDRRFAAMPWRDDPDNSLYSAWHLGQTGIPLVDAGMKELWATGWMHNRVRMVVGSFLVKNLRLPWQLGEEYFRDTLVDWDLASNSMGWQWVAGCGADAAPYFRIFNPVRQGERFDPEGEYVRRWLPQLGALNKKQIHQPWTAPAATLDSAGIRLGKDYPWPITDLQSSRREALEAFQSIKG
ncbi:deoxyribodipyrimidine photolyase [Halorhodospira halochloris]|uniref:Deoxyribodipyrimidine photo-lyase n=1 Tax=Halorhodospira halochloris TaxID=1052 RepID=A0A0X8X7J3_HALHR|nr:deoxyribodipyrimidine photo-lyase [Halorhodospira halochloris]MBK1652249.1 deoxyribodipyrimidine photolyase [Halorhodospira halochloris]BAU56959.1 deoxyribodipyrimidine photolyase [Halorhodospira halochloris]